MNFSVETIDQKDRILIVSKNKYSFLNQLKEELIQRGCEVFFSSEAPKKNSHFKYCFYINQAIKHPIAENYNISIFINKNHEAEKSRRIKINNYKIISILGNEIGAEQIDRILWFSFSSSSERFLSFTAPIKIGVKNKSFSNFNVKLILFLTPMRLLAIFIIFIISLHLIFLPILLFSYIYTYNAYKSISKEDFSAVKRNVNLGKNWLSLSKNLYSIVQPTYALFSISIFPDQLIDVNDKALSIFNDSINVIENGQSIIKDFFSKEKSAEEISYMVLKIENVKNKLANIEENLTVLQSKIPFRFVDNHQLKSKVANIVDEVVKIRKILKYSDDIFAKETEKKYLLIFANNMEIRPGGGFIGSFGIVTIKNFTFGDLKIYDVYDADGQLTAHIEPPNPIKKYLNMPHLFLRDSNYSPDFIENYELSKLFLAKELNMADFSGSIVITTSAIESLLDAFGDVYLPDFRETINKKNFYLKTQIHVESNFFPGSTQKKTYLASLTKQLLLDLETVSVKKLSLAIKKSLDEKLIAVFIEDPNIQEVIDSLYWSGRAIQPVCPPNINNCVIDYLFPFDMNVGPNKVNYFIKRTMSQKTKINEDGSIKNIFSIQLRNESSLSHFPGGKYRNYFQIYLSPNTTIEQITNNGTLIENYETKNDRYTSIGFFLEINPQSQSEIKIVYKLPTTFFNGKGVYQLIVQKQIGSSNNDFAFELQLPKNIYVKNQNFSPLVKDNEIIYNTILSADKIFYIELTKN